MPPPDLPATPVSRAAVAASPDPPPDPPREKGGSAVPAGPAPGRVGVGVGVLVVHQGLVLLGRRLGAHGAGSWAAPGGALAFGEGLEACAARELHEETGLEARHYELGPYTSDVHAEAGRHDLTVFVVARGIVGTPARREPDRCEGWAWFPWDRWPQPLFAPLASLRAIGWRPGGA
ncbi:nucleotide triphosphate diphosphatase NUDT15 [Piscinibacter sakaiensis]|uniref:nucleotide triphosphate diphosphatase NUDT15 n=1 Tax=Piscinibacter sakaiensis TaxID=1547922 RepID=UPI0009E88E00|nr:NUDIX domain-containing protein [Piscinibacter sakaiensis]